MTRRGLRVAVALFACAAVSAGCGESEYRYVSHSDTRTYLKVPREWKRYDQDILAAAEAVLLEQSGEDAPSAVDRRVEELIQWRVAFDAAAEPSPINVAGLGVSDDVVVDLRVRLLSDRERDEVNQSALRNVIVPYDELIDAEAGTQEERPFGAAVRSDFRVLREEEINRSGGLRGLRLIVQFRLARGRVHTLDQVALVDGENTRLWVLAVRASEQQYFRNLSRIDEIVESFTIEQKD